MTSKRVQATRRPLARLVLAFVALAALCAGCGRAGQAPTPHEQHNTDPAALQGKISAMLDDECASGDPRKVYSACDKYFAELVGTANAIHDAAPGHPPAVQHAYQQLQQAMRQYSSHNCGPADQRIQPSKTPACAQALRTARAGLNQAYHALYPKGS